MDLEKECLLLMGGKSFLEGGPKVESLCLFRIKCLKNKYDTAHKNAPKTGVEQFKKITNK